MNQLVPTENTSTKEIGFAVGAGGTSIAPQNLGEVIRFAEVMCRADIALPQHLRGNAGACMAVALQALEWQMSPFAVASKSYAVSGRIAYEAQLIAAVVNTRSGIKGRLRYEYIGEGNDLACRVTGVLDGQECEYETPPIGSILVKNSPLWKSDPRQQLGYFAARSWARRHCPEVILGVYDRDELEHQGPTNAKDVTPSVMSRLQERQADAPAREGFDHGHVLRETAALSDEAGNEQETPSDAPPSNGEGSDGAPVSPDPQAVAADNPEPASGGPAEEEAPESSEPDKPAHGEQAASSSELSAEDRDWLKQTAHMLWAATGVGEQDVLKNQMAGIRDNLTPAGISQAARAKANSINSKCKLVCFGEASAADTLALIAGIAGCEAKDVTA
jgi:hypothetical protein